MKYKLFLDDIRTVGMVYKDLSEQDFVVARNFKEFISTIIQRGLPGFISFDNDLGLDDNGNVAPDGYAAAKWLIYESGFDLTPLKFNVHSANPVASEQIKSLLNNYMKHNRNLSEEVVKKYALGLQNLDLELIASILHPEFKFVYRIGNGMGHGIRTDIRYIGHMFKTFASMRNEGLTIKTEFCNISVEGVKYLGIRLLPPHDRRVVFPMYLQEPLQQSEMIMMLRVKNGQLCKIECYTPHEFDYMIGGEISPYIK
jgi:hypothetical protein